jgi:hypothetical protein
MKIESRKLNMTVYKYAIEVALAPIFSYLALSWFQVGKAVEYAESQGYSTLAYVGDAGMILSVIYFLIFSL